MVRRNIEASDAGLRSPTFRLRRGQLGASIRDGVFLEGGILTDEEIKAEAICLCLSGSLWLKRNGESDAPASMTTVGTLLYVHSDLRHRSELQVSIEYTTWEIHLRNRLVAYRMRDSDQNIGDFMVLPGVAAFDFFRFVTARQPETSGGGAYSDTERLKAISSVRVPTVFRGRYFSLSSPDGDLRWEKMQTPYDVDNFLLSGVNVHLSKGRVIAVMAPGNLRGGTGP